MIVSALTAKKGVIVPPQASMEAPVIPLLGPMCTSDPVRGSMLVLGEGKPLYTVYLVPGYPIYPWTLSPKSQALNLCGRLRVSGLGLA